jgi:subtilisin family serine protease
MWRIFLFTAITGITVLLGGQLFAYTGSTAAQTIEEGFNIRWINRLTPGIAYERDSVLAMFDPLKIKNSHSTTPINWLIQEFTLKATRNLQEITVQQGQQSVQKYPGFEIKFEAITETKPPLNSSNTPKICGKKIVRFRIKPPSSEAIQSMDDTQAQTLIGDVLKALQDAGGKPGNFEEEAIQWPIPSGAQLPGGNLEFASTNPSNWAFERVYFPDKKLLQQPNEVSRAKVRIAVLDTGLSNGAGIKPYASCENALPNESSNDCVDRYQTTQLNGKLLNGHGTGVAGIIAGASGDKYSIGVAPSVKIWPVKVCGQSDFGDQKDVWNCPTPSVVRAICEVTNVEKPESRPQIINLSLAGLVPDIFIRRAIQDANANRILVVSAAGNCGSPNSSNPLERPEKPCSKSTTIYNHPMYPAAFASNELPDFRVDALQGTVTGLISVASANDSDHRYPYSTNNAAVTLSAPGQSITTYPNDSKFGFQVTDGTSFASAYVTGAAAMYLAEFQRKHPQQNTPSPAEIKQSLMQGIVDKVKECSTCGSGILNIPKVIQSVP